MRRTTTEPNSKTHTHHFPLLLFFVPPPRFLAKQGAQGRGSLCTGAGRREDNDTSMVLSTAATSPEGEENGVKNDVTLSGHGLETDRPARTFQAGTPLSGERSAKIIKKRKAA